jgi:hypothetical protein
LFNYSSGSKNFLFLFFLWGGGGCATVLTIKKEVAKPNMTILSTFVLSTCTPRAPFCSEFNQKPSSDYYCGGPADVLGRETYLSSRKRSMQILLAVVSVFSIYHASSQQSPCSRSPWRASHGTVVFTFLCPAGLHTALTTVDSCGFS